MDKSFQGRLVQAMKEQGISQAELSRRTSINRSIIWGYVHGQYKAKQRNLYLISKVLDVNEAWLMGLTDNQRRDPSSVPSTGRFTTDEDTIDEIISNFHSWKGDPISEEQREYMKQDLKKFLDMTTKLREKE